MLLLAAQVQGVHQEQARDETAALHAWLEAALGILEMEGCKQSWLRDPSTVVRGLLKRTAYTEGAFSKRIAHSVPDKTLTD